MKAMSRRKATAGRAGARLVGEGCWRCVVGLAAAPSGRQVMREEEEEEEEEGERGEGELAEEARGERAATRLFSLDCRATRARLAGYAG